MLSKAFLAVLTLVVGVPMTNMGILLAHGSGGVLSEANMESGIKLGLGLENRWGG
jgi:hypothetical protein